MKKVLIVVYEFPPYRTSGVYRPLKFVKYLWRLGWEPVVLTVKNHPTDTVDMSLLEKYPPETKIYKAYSFELKRLEQAFFNRFFKKNDNGQPQTTAVDNPPGKQTESKGSFKETLKKLIFSPISRFTHSYLYCPDSRIGWKYKAVPLGKKIVKKEKIDLIFSSSPPDTNHIVAKKISQKTGVPLVVDFRDPWTDNFNREGTPPYIRAKEKKMEREVLTHAEKIINIGKRFVDLSLRSFPEIDPSKHHAITNGYDEEDFNQYDCREIYEANKTDYFNILNVGTIYENSGISSFLKAWKILSEDEEFNQDTKISFIGNLFPDQKKILSSEPFSRTSRLLGFKAHNEATRMMMSSDLLLLMPSGGDEQSRDKIIPGKLFELMRSGRPVFLIGWEGEASEIILNSGNGYFADTHDIDGIVNCIKTMKQLKKEGKLGQQLDWNYIRQFSRENLTRRLIEVFDRALK